jgi:hypothetical protein
LRLDPNRLVYLQKTLFLRPSIGRGHAPFIGYMDPPKYHIPRIVPLPWEPPVPREFQDETTTTITPCPYNHRTLYFCLVLCQRWSNCFPFVLKARSWFRRTRWEERNLTRGNSAFTFLNIFLAHGYFYWEASVSAQGIQDEAFEQLRARGARAGDSLVFFFFFFFFFYYYKTL